MNDRTSSRGAVSASGALARLAVAARLGVDARDLERSLLRSLSGERPEALGMEDLARAVASADLRAEVVELDLEGVQARLAAGRPLVLRLAPREPAGSAEVGVAEPRWAVLLGDRARGIQAEIYGPGEERIEEVFPPQAVAEGLGLHAGEPVACLHLTSRARSRPRVQVPVGSPTPLARLLKLFRPDRGDVLAVIVFAVTIGVLLLATPIAVQALVNFVAVGGAIPPLIVVVLLLAAGLVFAGVLSACQAWIVEILQRRLFVRMVADLAARLPRVSLEVYDRKYGPELVNRFFDVMTIQKTGSALLLDGLSIVLSVIVGLIVLAFYHPLLLAFDIILLAIIALIVLGPMRRGVRTAIDESKAKYEVAGWLEEVARYPLLYRTFGARRFLFQRSDQVARKYLECRTAHYRVLFAQIIGALGLHALASTALLGIGGMLVIQGSLTLGQLVAAELIVTMVVNAVSKMGKHLESYYDLNAATDKLGYLLDLPLEPSGEVRYLAPVRSPGAGLELRGVTREQPGGTPLFANVSVKVGARQSLGIRGASGSGKSALLELLWGLRRPDSGVVALDGHDLRDLSLEDLRRSAALVADIEVVSGTVRENVQLGRELVSDEEVRLALERVGLREKLEALPEGLETELNARGWPLSEGEIRCLQVARAIVDPPRLLIVSDVFLQLSDELRSRLLDTLFDADAGWTLVVASNSEEVLARCDQILELPGGAVRPGPGGMSSLSA